MNIPQTLDRFHVSLSGKLSSDKTLIFLNGFGTTQDIWKQVAGHLQSDFRLVCYDQIGSRADYVDSASDNKYSSSLEAHADDLLLICEELGIDSAILVGHSVSGIVASIAAIKKPQLFQKIVMIGASARYLDDHNYVGGFMQSDIDHTIKMMKADFMVWTTGFAEVAVKNSNYPSMAEYFATTLSQVRPDIAASTLKLILEIDFRELLTGLLAETLVIQSQDDTFVPLDAAIYLCKIIPNSKLALIDAEGHFPHLTTPIEVVNEIRGFLN